MDRITASLDTSRLKPLIATFTNTLEAKLNDACRVTAESAVREMQTRLSRQLGPNATGKTVDSIKSQPAYDGRGWIVLTDDVRADGGQVVRGPNTKARIAPDYYQEKHVPLWLEKGTRPGKRKNNARTQARPFFYASLKLEESGHRRRILDAMDDAANLSGLGD